MALFMNYLRKDRTKLECSAYVYILLTLPGPGLSSGVWGPEYIRYILPVGDIISQKTTVNVYEVQIKGQKGFLKKG